MTGKTGKLDWRTMSILLNSLPIRDPDLVMGPSQGEDAGVVRVGEGFMVVHSDPITTGVKHAGYLSIHVAANDLAVRGVRPRWFLPTVLVSPKASREELELIFKDMGRALEELEGVAVGGHTEVTPGLDRTIIIVTAIGYTNGRVIMTRDATPGDVIVSIGRIGGEGAGVLAWDWENELVRRNVSLEVIAKAREFVYDVSVVKVALELRSIVNSMHDVTEGGLIQALRELAIASGSKVVINTSMIKLDPVVEKVVKTMGLDLLRILSSGCLIATLPENKVDQARQIAEKHGKDFSVLGRVESSGEPILLLVDGGKISTIDSDVVDEIYKVWELF